MINEVFRSKVNLDYFNPYISGLISNTKEIEIQDFGAGSRKGKANTNRTIAKIYKKSSSSPKKADLIRRISEYERKSFTFLELGTNLGLTSYALSQSKACNKVISIEGCPNLHAFTKEKLDHPKVELINAQFDDVLEQILIEQQPKIVYIDGNHTYDATLNYFKLIQKHNCVDLIIFDDIHWSKGMLEAWNTVIKDKQFHVSINVFQLGLLYRRNEQEKEDFIIRY